MIMKKISYIALFICIPFVAGAFTNNGDTVNWTNADLAQWDAQNVINAGPNGTITANAESMSIVRLENNETAGRVDINLTGDLTLTGSLENSSAAGTQIDAANIVVGTTMKNDSGLLDIASDSLMVNGATAFVNTTDFLGNITGATKFVGGIDIGTMGANNTFTLNTGTLDLGTQTQLTNERADVDIKVSNGALNSSGALAIINRAGTMDLTAQSANLTSVETVAGALNIVAQNDGAIDVTGAVNGAANTTTNILADGALTVGDAVNNAGTMALNGKNVSLSDSVVNSGAGALEILGWTDSSGSVAITGDITNSSSGDLTINARQIDIGGDMLNSGTGTLVVKGSDTDNGAMTVGRIDSQNGSIYIDALIDSVTADGAISATGGSINFGKNTKNITADEVDITGNLTANAGIVSGAGNMNFMSTIPAMLDSANVYVGGNVDGGIGFKNLENMQIGGNYTFDDNSFLHVIASDSANYWGTATEGDGNQVGTIGGATGSLITVGGQFISDINTDGAEKLQVTLQQAINDSTRALRLVSADGGILELGDFTMSDVAVRFCNLYNTLCTDIYDLPGYIAKRDGDLWLVFDEGFLATPIFKIQPIVDAENGRTEAEYATAGALDNLVAGQLNKNRFYGNAPLEAVDLAFDGIFTEMGDELYARMVQYGKDDNGTALQNFSRLFAPHELHMLVGSIALDEHTINRDFEDRMLDEFIWDRNRKLSRAWLEFDYAMFDMDVGEYSPATGNRLNVLGGVDWMTSNTLGLGLTAHITHTTANMSDNVDIAYNKMPRTLRDVNVDTTDLTIGVGGYMYKIISQGLRAYGNVFLDAHLLDVSRTQPFIGDVEGSGTTFALFTEWGLMHDILNEYLVGNLYARAGYNTGFSITEQVRGADYAKLESDGYINLTPGYTLILQKRIYPSDTFQIRPYLSAGVEYDVLGGPDKTRFKFAPADRFTEYDADIDPLWMNVGGGVELLSATHIQFGLDYRYQHNADIQMHKIKLSGSYRF